MTITEYLEQFKTKEEVKAELERLSKCDKIDFNLMKKKNILYQHFNNVYCVKRYYMDDLGRTHFYYEEI